LEEEGSVVVYCCWPYLDIIFRFRELPPVYGFRAIPPLPKNKGGFDVLPLLICYWLLRKVLPLSWLYPPPPPMAGYYCIPMVAVLVVLTTTSFLPCLLRLTPCYIGVFYTFTDAFKFVP